MVCFVVVLVVWENLSNGFLLFFSWSPISAYLCVGLISASNPLLHVRKLHLSSQGKPVRKLTQRHIGFFGEGEKATKLGRIQTRNTSCSSGHTQGISSPRYEFLKTGGLRQELLLQSKHLASVGV